jgi:uncharacterized damage-inducible protein DinB
MPALQPEQALFLLHSAALPSLTAEHPLTKRVILAIPLDRGDYRPDAVSKTALELAWHIVTAENRFLDGVASGEFTFGGPARPDTVRTSADIVAWYGESFEKNMARLKQLSGEQLVEVLDFRGLFQFPAVVYLFAGLNHTIHHRGQLSMYLRPMGAKVPSIYGESYDSAQARQAAQSPAGKS